MNLARRAALLAGLPAVVAGTTVNRFCASSLQTTRMAFHAIRAGEGDVYVAAGVESISQVDGYPKSTDELHPGQIGEGYAVAALIDGVGAGGAPPSTAASGENRSLGAKRVQPAV